MSTQPKTKYTPEEYLALERQSAAKSEYFAGEIFLMAGASERHNLIVANLIAEWRNQLKNRPCKVYPSDMRVKISDSGLYTYPDVSIVCGEAEFEDDRKDTLINPTLIVEVLSESSEAYDRGKKFEHYRRISSLSHYLLVAQDKPEVELFVRQVDGKWLFSAYSGFQSKVMLDSIHCELLLQEVYDKVTF
ncbi:MAG: Uma2 family endonuclease [Acidobacteriota bacterium]